MTQTIEERNKALVLEAFDTLFNKRDYEAAKRRPYPARTRWIVQSDQKRAGDDAV